MRETFFLAALVLLAMAGLAFGLRVLDRRIVPAGNGDAPAPDVRIIDDGSAMMSWLSDYLGLPAAQAAEFNPAKYKAAPVQRTVSLQAVAGEEVPVELKFKNLGSVTWKPAGKAFVSVYTISPRYHAGVFSNAGWMSKSQPAKLASASVKSGQTGSVKFTAKAPTKAGVYSETYQLAAEDTAWVWGGFVTVKITVKAKPVAPPASVAVQPAPHQNGAGPAPAPAPADSPAAPAVPAPEPLKAWIVNRSAERLEAPGGMSFNVGLSIKNSGTSLWKKWGIRFVSAKSAAGADVEVDDSAWVGPDQVILKEQPVFPDHNAEFNFPVTIPRTRGDYSYRFVFVADGLTLDSAPIDLPVTVMSDAPAPPTPYVPPAAPAPAPIQISQTGDPTIRVGLYTTDHEEVVTSTGSFEVRSADGVLLGSFTPGAVARFRYDPPAARYLVDGDGVSVSSVSPVRFVQTGGAQFFTVLSLEDRPAWNKSLNDNMFRGVLELRKNDANQYVWLIDELPMEQYLRGLAETSDNSPAEFQKALASAARTYAYWHLTHPGKHWHFTVDATYDQVYKGYGAEIRLPHFTQAVGATFGQMVTWQGDVVVTPYFSWSDGRTRAWTEVWGGAAKPWLVSVPAPHDAGKTLFGHGVGMSAWDAIGRANDGGTYDTILAYYYTGTGLKKAY